MIHLTRKFVPSPYVLKLFLFMSIVWAAIVGPFSSVLILKNFGATSPQIGIFTAVCAVISMVFQPVWGFISDKIGSPRRVLCFCLGVSSVFFGCVLLAKNFYAAAGLLMLDSMFRCCVIALLDSHTLSEINVIPGLQYSYIRMGASIFYGILSVIYSGVIKTMGIMAIVPISVVIAALAVFWGLFIAKGKWEANKNRDGVHRVKSSLKKEAISLLKNKQYILFVIFVAFWSFSTLPLYTFIIDYVTAVGGDPGDVPMIHALRCVAELPSFVLAVYIGKKMDAKTLMLAGMCFSLSHMAGLLFAHTFFWLAACNLLAAPGFILGLAGRMRYLNEITPESVRSTSITVMGACEIGLGSIAGNLMAGFVSGVFGTRALTFVVMATICAAICMLMIIYRRRE